MTRPLLFLFDRGSALALTAAPRAFRQAFGDDLRQTLREVCLDARARKGIVAMSMAGAREVADIARSAVRMRIRGPAHAQPPDRRRRARRQSPLASVLARDIRMGTRALLASRSYTALAVLTLAVGIGMTASAFSVLDSLILRPVPFAQSDRLVEIWNKREPTGVTYPRLERSAFLEWRAQEDLFDRVEGYEASSAIWRGPRSSEMIPAAFVTPGLFDMLGVPPIAGRYFGEGDGREGSDGLVVVSERFWRRQMAGRPDAVGQTLTLNGTSHRVIGLMPASFRFPNQAQELWLPLDLAAPPAARMAGPLAMTPLARMVRGASFEAVTSEVESRAPRLLESLGMAQEGLTATTRDPSQLVDRAASQSLLLLASAAGFLLLIVCANVANLSLSHALARSRDFAVRVSLGASRGDLIRQTLVENALVGAAGMAVGLVCAWLFLQAAMASLPPSMFLASLNEVDLDARTIAFTGLVGLVTLALFGLPPAVIASQPAVANVLRRDSRSVTGSRAARRLRSALVVAEVSVSIVLLVGAALMARSFVKLQSVDRGFDAAELAAVRVGLPTAGYLDPQSQDRFSEDLMRAFSRLPGVRAATAGSAPPDADLITFGNVEFEHVPDVTAEQVIIPVYRVWPNYFSTTGIPVVEGRPFGPVEPPESTIISRSFADKYWPGLSAVGGRFRFTGSRTWRTVIGVAGEVRQLDMDDAMGAFEFYYPMRVVPGDKPPTPRASTDAIAAYRTFVIRADDPAAVLVPARTAVTSVDENVVIWDVKTVEENFSAAVARPRVVLFMLAVFATMGLLLAAAGLYGVLSYLVGQRLKEIGIRLALGATPREIFRLVMRGGLALTAVGLATGLLMSIGLVRLMRTLLFEVEPTDPVSLLVVGGLLSATAVVATWRPAVRAMRVDPVALLRQD